MSARWARLLGGWRTPLLLGLVGIVFVLVSPGWAGTYVGGAVGTGLVYAISMLGLSLLAAWNGRWSLGHGAFLAIGAFGASWLLRQGLPIELVVLVETVVGAVLGGLVGAVARRFSVLYLAIVTFVIALVVAEVMLRVPAISGGSDGVNVPSPESVLGVRLGPDAVLAATVAVAALTFALAARMRASHQAGRWLAVKASPAAAASIGIREGTEQAAGFALSAAAGTAAGVPYALLLGYLTPDSFTFTLSVLLLVGAVVGGIGSLAGAAVGAVYLVGLPEVLRGAETLQHALFGASVIAAIILYPRGLAPLAAAVARRLRRRAPRTPPEPSRRPPEVGAAEPVRLRRPAEPPAQLEISDLTVRFGGMTAVDTVSLHVASGECLGLIGPNGAGKTTLLNAVSGLVAAERGSAARVAGRELLGLPAGARPAAGVARTFQHAELFGGLTVRRTLELAATSSTARGPRGLLTRLRDADPAAPARAEEVLAQLDLLAVADVVVDELPFGIQKMVDLGRAVVTRPRFLLLDEPFSGLDPAEVALAGRLVAALPGQGIGVVLIDHAVDLVLGIADRVTVLSFGTVLATGKPEEVRADPAVVAAYLGTPALDGPERQHA